MRKLLTDKILLESTLNNKYIVFIFSQRIYALLVINPPTKKSHHIKLLTKKNSFLSTLLCNPWLFAKLSPFPLFYQSNIDEMLNNITDKYFILYYL